jgi:hypothetical protein
MPKARHQPGGVLPMEGQVRRPRGVLGAPAAHAGGGERVAEEAAGRSNAGRCHAKDIVGKN